MLTMYQTMWASTYAATFSSMVEELLATNKGLDVTECTFDLIADASSVIAKHAASRAQEQYDKRE
jgi:hypothetical protein